MKGIVVGLSAAFLLGMAGMASAGLCPKYAGMFFTADVGTCTTCGGHTASGAFKLCAKCSDKVPKCENCMAALAAPDGEAKAKPGTPKTPDKKTAPKSSAVELSAEHNGKTVTVAPGKNITIRLAGNITTGYAWEVAEITGQAVKAQGEPAYVDGEHPPGVEGGGGTFVIKLRAVKPGKSTVKLIYVRDKKDTPTEEDIFTTRIEVQK